MVDLAIMRLKTVPLPFAVLATISIGVAPAGAAVRICHGNVSSEIVTAPTELEAKKKAISEWQAKAAKFGAGLDVWRLAAEKALKCFPKDGVFECVAFGHPCIIEQNPNRRPVGKDGKGAPL